MFIQPSELQNLIKLYRNEEVEQPIEDQQEEPKSKSSSSSSSEEPSSKEESMVEELDMQQKMEYSEEEIKE